MRFDIVATELALDDHVAAAVRSCVDPSENVPYALNWTVKPGCTTGLLGITVIATRSAADAGEVPIMASIPAKSPASRNRRRADGRLFEFLKRRVIIFFVFIFLLRLDC